MYLYLSLETSYVVIESQDIKGKWVAWKLVPLCSNLYKADTLLKRTAWCGPAGVRFNEVLLYYIVNYSLENNIEIYMVIFFIQRICSFLG